MAKKRKIKLKVLKANRWHAVPLKGSFMLTSILGVLLSYYYVYPVSPSLSWACIIIFTLMFCASLISMTKAPLVAHPKNNY